MVGLTELLILLVIGALSCGGLLIPVVIVVVLVRGTSKKTKMGINVKRTDCPDCNTKMPAFRKPSNMRQAMWGGWTCQECGLELDKWGRPLDGRTEDAPPESKQ